MGTIFYLLYLFISFVRFPEMYPALAPYHLMTVMGVVGLLIALFALLMNITRALQKTTVLVLIFVGVLGVSQVMAGWTGGAIFAWESFSIRLAMYLMMVGIVQTLPQLRKVVVCIIVSIIALACVGVLDYHRNAFNGQFVLREPIYINDQLTDQSTERIRAMGELSDPNDFAQVVLIGMVALSMFWKKRATVRNLLVIGFPMSFLFYVLYLTHSRGGLVGLAVATLLAFQKRLGRLFSVFVTIAMLGLILQGNFTGGRDISASDDSARARLEFWSEGLVMLRSHPLFGVGYSNYPEENSGRAAHNSFIQCAAELGLPGYLLWIGMIVLSMLGLAAVRKLPAKEPDEIELRNYAEMARVALLVYLITGWFLSRAYTEILFTLLGMAVAINVIAKQSGRRVEEPTLEKMIGTTAGVAIGTLFLLKVMIRLHG